MTLEQLREQNGAITVEAYNIGQGFLVEPSLYSKGVKSTGDITVDFLQAKTSIIKVLLPILAALNLMILLHRSTPTIWNLT